MSTITQQQLAMNIDTVIEYLWRVPGVVNVEVEDNLINREHEMWDKKVRVTFAGCDELVVIELY